MRESLRVERALALQAILDVEAEFLDWRERSVGPGNDRLLGLVGSFPEAGNDIAEGAGGAVVELAGRHRPHREVKFRSGRNEEVEVEVGAPVAEVAAGGAEGLVGGEDSVAVFGGQNEAGVVVESG